MKQFFTLHASDAGSQYQRRRMTGLTDVPSFLRALAGHDATGAARAFCVSLRGGRRESFTLGGHVTRLAGCEPAEHIFSFDGSVPSDSVWVALSCVSGIIRAKKTPAKSARFACGNTRAWNRRMNRDEPKSTGSSTAKAARRKFDYKCKSSKRS